MAAPAHIGSIPAQDHSRERYECVALAPIDHSVQCLDAALRSNCDEDEFPDKVALQAARYLLSRVAFWVDGVPEPIGILAIDRGVQVAWSKGDHNVRLFCSPVNGKSYVYTSRTENGKTSQSDLIRQVDTFSLADALNWLSR